MAELGCPDFKLGFMAQQSADAEGWQLNATEQELVEAAHRHARKKERELAEEQWLRDEEATRHAVCDADAVARQAYLDNPPDCPCCPKPGPGPVLAYRWTHSYQQLETIKFVNQGGIHSKNGSMTFYPQELLNQLSMHLAEKKFNDFNTEALIRRKIQYLSHHSDLKVNLEKADWLRKGLAMGDYENDKKDDDRARADWHHLRGGVGGPRGGEYGIGQVGGPPRGAR